MNGQGDLDMGEKTNRFKGGSWFFNWCQARATRRCGTVTFLVMMLGFMVSGCVRVHRDLSKHPDYSVMIGRKYRTKVDTLLYRNGLSRKIYLDIIGGTGLPDKEKLPNKFPFKYYGTTILGILPVGSEFEITGAFMEGAYNAAFEGYHAVIVKTENQNFFGTKIYDAVMLTNCGIDTTIPEFETKYVEEVKSEKQEESGK